MRLLLVEDKDNFRRLLLKALKEAGWDVIEAPNPTKAIEILESETVEILVTDLRMPVFSGIELLKRAKRLNPTMGILLMSAFGEPKDIVEAMQSGADDFLPKPFDLDFFLERLNKLRLLVMSPPPNPNEPWVVASSAMQGVEKCLRTMSDTSQPVLFVGQVGSGRSRAARRLHVLRHPTAMFHSMSSRDLTPESLSETFLKNHTGGSLLIKDLDYLPSATLSTLIQCMEHNQGICWMGTCKEPADLPESLKSHIGVISITLAPLADRRDDILPIFHTYIAETCNREGRLIPAVDRMIERELYNNKWHGNVAELIWVASETIRRCMTGLIQDLPIWLTPEKQSILLPMPPKDKLDKMLGGIKESAERYFLEKYLHEANDDLSVAANRLGLTTKSFIQKLKEYGISLKDV
ncbi:MAG: response regulator [Holophagaceae bacterium]|nr:response regulator [Holophagaceae bacterium]